MNEGISYEEYLARNGTLTYSNVGVSMLPLLRQGKDLFTVERKGAERCRRGDVVLFKRDDGRAVLHRVIAVRDGSYDIMGDNCVAKEKGVTDGEILGVMTSFTRSGKTRSVRSAGYRIYTAIIVNTVPVRVLLKKAKILLTRAVS